MSELDDLARTAAERVAPDRALPLWPETAAKVIADVYRPLAERAEKLEAMLRRIAWRHRGCCPVCAGSATVHFSGCELAALLAPAPPQVFPEAKQASPDIEATQEPFFVIFDGPPEHVSGRFVEVETADGRGVSAGEWEQRKDGYWSLGPFVKAPPQVFPKASSDDIWASELSARVEALECWRASQRNDFGEHDEPKPMPAREAELRHGELHRANPFVCAAVAEIDRLRAEVAEAAARDAWRDIAENVLKRKLAERTSERNEALAEAAALRKVRDAAQAYRVCPTGCYECEALLDEALAVTEPTETKL